MQEVYTARTLAEAHLIRAALAEEGIPSEVRNEHVFSLRGEVPMTPDSMPSVWVDDDVVARAEVAIARRGADPGNAAALLEQADSLAEEDAADDEAADDQEAADEEDDETGEAADEVTDEDAYAALSDLYVAADRLHGKPGRMDLVAEVELAAETISSASAPFGFDPGVWARIGPLSAAVIEAWEEGDDADVKAAASALRLLLRDYV